MLQELGSGAFSTVYKVESSDDDRKSNMGNDEDIDRFQWELDSMAYLRHPNIVQLHDFFSDADNFYLILDYCAHDSCGVAHRDLKPQNILIDKFPAIKVSDFGLCGYSEDRKLMQTLTVSEQFDKREQEWNWARWCLL